MRFFLHYNQFLKVAEHNFRMRFCWYNSAHTQWLQKTNMPSIERSFYLLNTCSICVIFLYNWTQCIDGFSLLSQIHVRKGKDAKNSAILSFFFVTERTQLNAAIEWKFALSEIRLFLENHSLEFYKIWHFRK